MIDDEVNTPEAKSIHSHALPPLRDLVSAHRLALILAETRTFLARPSVVRKYRSLRVLVMAAAVVFPLAVPSSMQAYAVLAHEAIIDAAWKDNLLPLLKKRFPQATDEELQKAHASAYGGAIIQDMGYYPFGSHLFSDLTHYVRSGDFILALIRDAQDVNEYAFALGALSHAAADDQGHSLGTNLAVPLMFPKLARKFGREVPYEKDPTAHVRVEFSFDVEQVAEGNYAPQAYHDFIGFDVQKRVLEQAFNETYGLEMKNLFLSEDISIGTYRNTVSGLIPEMTRVAWDIKKKDIVKNNPKATQRTYIYRLTRQAYRNEWGSTYRQPGIGTRILAFFLRVLPKVGPLKALAFRAPTPQVEDLFQKSFAAAVVQYKQLLAQQAQDRLQLPNENFDTGHPLGPGSYKLADNAYATLVEKLHGKSVPDDLRKNILDYYADLNRPFATKRDPKRWAKVSSDVEQLKAAR